MKIGLLGGWALQKRAGIYTYNDRLNIDPNPKETISGTAFIRTYKYFTLRDATYIFSIKIGREAAGNPSTVD